jgi:hypothetical protein
MILTMNSDYFVGFEFLTTPRVKMAVLWALMMGQQVALKRW